MNFFFRYFLDLVFRAIFFKFSQNSGFVKYPKEKVQKLKMLKMSLFMKYEATPKISTIFWPFLAIFTLFHLKNLVLVNNELCSMPPSWAPPDINIMPGESCGAHSDGSVKLQISRLLVPLLSQLHRQFSPMSLTLESSYFAPEWINPLYASHSVLLGFVVSQTHTFFEIQNKYQKEFALQHHQDIFRGKFQETRELSLFGGTVLIPFLR